MAVATGVELETRAYAVPTDGPESDATLEWDSTSIVVVRAHAEGETGLGYTYAPAAAAAVVDELLAPGFCALSAVDVALWDLKARLLGVPLVELLGAAHAEVPVYGSGGFCSYTLDRLQEQLAGWVEQGIPRVKLKVGRHPDEDARRVATAREAIGPDAELFADANGAYTAKTALDWAERLASEWDVTWFEEPVSSADLDGLRHVRERGPAGLEIAAGEYAYVPADFRNLVGCVDVLQADVTRCGGITGLLHLDGLAACVAIDVSAHCAPALSAHAFCALERARHLEWFHDHVRVEPMLFDGVLEPVDGALRPDRSRPGHGLELKEADAEEHRIR